MMLHSITLPIEWGNDTKCLDVYIDIDKDGYTIEDYLVTGIGYVSLADMKEQDPGIDYRISMAVEKYYLDNLEAKHD